MVASPGLASIASRNQERDGFRNAQIRFNQVVRLGEASAPEPFRAPRYVPDHLTERLNEAAKEIPKADHIRGCTPLHLEGTTRKYQTLILDIGPADNPGAGNHYRISGGFLPDPRSPAVRYV